MSVKSHMLTSFRFLPIEDSPTRAAEGLSHGEIGIVVAQHKEPVALVTNEVLREVGNLGYGSLRRAVAELPGIVLAGARIEMDMLARRVVSILEAGAKGTVILGKTGIVGVVPVQSTIAYMRQHEVKYESILHTVNSMGGGRVGSIVLASDRSGGGVGQSLASMNLEGSMPPMPPIKVFCSTCWFLNYFAAHPLAGDVFQCQNKNWPVHDFTFI